MIAYSQQEVAYFALVKEAGKVLIADCEAEFLGQEFVTSYDMNDWHVPSEQAKIICDGPGETDEDFEVYRNTWNDVQVKAFAIIDGMRHHLFCTENTDFPTLYAVPDEKDWMQAHKDDAEDEVSDATLLLYEQKEMDEEYED